MQYVVAYAGAALIFCIMDFVWLGLIAKDFYAKHLGHLMAEQTKFSAAIAFYVLYLAGLTFFAIKPALQQQNPFVALALGAFLGLVAYASYDLTNMATLRDWSLTLTLVDIIWGAFISAVSALAGYYAVRLVLVL